MCWARYLISPSVPPGNEGICSTASKTVITLLLTAGSFPFVWFVTTTEPAIVCTGLYSSFFSSFNRNMTGTVYFTRTAFPFCIPGCQLGIVLMTRTASPSKSGSTPRRTPTLEMLPSVFTMNCTVTRPCVPFFCAFTGYLMFFPKNCTNPAIPPSGNTGICSTTSNTGLSGSLAGGFCHWPFMTIFIPVRFSCSILTPPNIYLLSFSHLMVMNGAFSKARIENSPFLSVRNDWFCGSLCLAFTITSAPSTGLPSLSTTTPW